VHRDTILAAPRKHRLPTVYSRARHVAGRLMSYGIDYADLPALGRLCRSHPEGHEPGDLPVQQLPIRTGDQPQDRQARDITCRRRWLATAMK